MNISIWNNSKIVVSYNYFVTIIYIINNVCRNMKTNQNMKKLSSFGIGGNVRCLAYPVNSKELKKLLNYIHIHKIKYFFIGSGSNLLIDDNGFDGIVISLKKTFKKLKIIKNKISAESGVMLGHMVKEAMKAGIGGLESLIGVPGTLGGALIMNAGAYGSEISNYITLKIGDIIFTGSPAGVGSIKIEDFLEGFIEDKLIFEFRIK